MFEATGFALFPTTVALFMFSEDQNVKGPY